MRIVFLCDNRAQGPFVAQHGLAAWVEVRGRRFLWDVGPNGLWLENADRLGIVPENAEAVLLSHGHYDHTGGLRAVVARTGGLRVLGHPDIFLQRFSVRKGERRPIGFPLPRKEVEDLGAVFELAEGARRLDDGIWLTGEVPKRTEFEVPEESFRTPSGEVDLLRDDQALVIGTDEGLVVLLGCGHSGAVNTVMYSLELTGERRVLALVGGMHLQDAPEERVRKTAEGLQKLGVERIVAAHCTGWRAACRLAEAFGERFVYAAAGMELRFP